MMNTSDSSSPSSCCSGSPSCTAALVLGIIALVRYQRRRAERVAAEDKPLSADEASRADALLKELDNK